MNRLTLSVTLLLLPATTMPQTTVNESMESGMATARILAARKAASAVTWQQCLADISSWEAKDNADRKAKIEQPNWWYEKLSTEELARLASETLACSAALRHANYIGDSREMVGYGMMFEDQLLNRAEAVLVEHQLMQAYLLKGSMF